MATDFQTYVDDSLLGTGHIDHAGIYSLTDEVFWALSAGFTPSPEEMGVIVGIVKGDEAVKDRAFSDGLYVAGNRYILTRAESRSIYARSGRTGIAVGGCGSAAVVAPVRGERNRAPARSRPLGHSRTTWGTW